ncbi:MAG TPA: hypothetical protein PKI49_04620 [Pseudomonadota bacterium]|nr:hypothetical protein [Pseudomonadota bacterium]HNI59459.1 hypothetical protein [Pseudomonadota bacterium]HNK45444.1 hypothetical protein [Pseudomonadota bacterium]HNN51557.1 hypothetical protein [Pseudomonadota bacterium]HNO67771.1 hypothetical protein [Pseudomonadota bacterium]
MRRYYRRLLLPAGTGFLFGDAVPSDLASIRYLHGSDPEDVICSVLAYAQQGQFAPCSRLLDLMAQHNDADIWGSCSTLLAFAAPRSILQQLIPLMERLRMEHGTDAPLQWAGETLARSREAWVVPAVLRLFEKIQSHERFMALPVYLSMLLEPEPAGIDAGPSQRPVVEEPDWYQPTPTWAISEYVRKVEGCRSTLVSSLSTPDRACLFDGAILSLRQVAMRTIRRIQLHEESALRIAEARLLLEAYTGEDFSGFYDEGQHRLLPLRASALLEAFLQTDTPERFEPGVRHFFGHRIPD